MTNEAAASDLCKHCGFCCDGTVFNQGDLRPEDLACASQYGILPDPSREHPTFPQPCRLFDGATCTIYATRFAACRSFRCKMLDRFGAGEIDMTQGLATIATARAMISAVGPEARTFRERRALTAVRADWHTVTDPVQRREAARRHLSLVVLEDFLTRHFRKNKRHGERAPSASAQLDAPNPKSAGPKACGNRSDRA